MRDGKINEGGPPTTRDWNEHEARFDDLSPKVLRNRVTPRGKADPLPELTPEQVAGRAVRLEKALRRLVEAFDVVAWDSRWTSRLNDAHSYGRKVIEEASAWTQPEEQPGTPLPEDAEGSSVIGRLAEGGE